MKRAAFNEKYVNLFFHFRKQKSIQFQPMKNKFPHFLRITKQTCKTLSHNLSK